MRVGFACESSLQVLLTASSLLILVFDLRPAFRSGSASVLNFYVVVGEHVDAFFPTFCPWCLACVVVSRLALVLWCVANIQILT